MIRNRLIIYLFLLIGVPILYFLFRDWIVAKWNSIESFMMMIAYLTSLCIFIYNADYKVYFFIQGLLLHFRFDSTKWIVTASYTISIDDRSIVDRLAEYLTKNDCMVLQKDYSSLIVQWQKEHNLSFRVNSDGIESGLDDNPTLHLVSTKITVPMRQIKAKTAELQELIEKLEAVIQPISEEQKRYQIDIEYSERSPYYRYWIKRVPGMIIKSFDCKLGLIDNKEGTVQVDNNLLYIKANQFTRLFQLTQECVLLKGI